MIKILYIGKNEKVFTLLESKNFFLQNILDIENQCIFNQNKFSLILIDSNLYSQYLNKFSCLNQNPNVILLYDENDNFKITNFNNVSNFYSYNYFLENLDLLISFIAVKEKNGTKIGEYILNYSHLEHKIRFKKNLINIHLYDLGFYYKNYGYAFLKSMINNFIDGLLSLLAKEDNLYILGQSDFFITSEKKDLIQLEILAKQIIHYFKTKNISIQEIQIKYKYKIALSHDENSLGLISI